VTNYSGEIIKTSFSKEDQAYVDKVLQIVPDLVFQSNKQFNQIKDKVSLKVGSFDDEAQDPQLRVHYYQ
jgi:hypothetical protein